VHYRKASTASRFDAETDQIRQAFLNLDVSVRVALHSAAFLWHSACGLVLISALTGVVR
jgi:hypothetical protein